MHAQQNVKKKYRLFCLQILSSGSFLHAKTFFLEAGSFVAKLHLYETVT